MKSGWRVTQADVQDLDDLAAVFNEYRIFYGKPSDVQKARQFLAERIERKESTVFLARMEESRTIAGFTQLYPLFSSLSMKRIWLLNDLFVVEDFRQQGIAQALLDKAKQHARLTGALGIELATGLDNTRAQRLYERNGYVKDEEYFHYFLDIGGV